MVEYFFPCDGFLNLYKYYSVAWIILGEDMHFLFYFIFFYPCSEFLKRWNDMNEPQVSTVRQYVPQICSPTCLQFFLIATHMLSETYEA